MGRTPYGVATDPTGTRIFVGNDTDGTVSVIDAATNRVVANVSTGAQPRAFGAFAAAAPAVAPSCEDQLAPLRQQIVLLQDQLATDNAMIADLTSQNATLTSENATLASQNATLTAQNAALRDQVANLQQQLAAANAALLDLSNQIAVLKAKNAALESQVASLQQKLAEYTTMKPGQFQRLMHDLRKAYEQAQHLLRRQ